MGGIELFEIKGQVCTISLVVNNHFKKAADIEEDGTRAYS
jgi:hypothetical protein